MDKEELKSRVLAAVEDYVSKPEAWEEAQVVINPADGSVELMEIEDTDNLPDEIDVYAVMDLIEMTPDGRWVPDPDAISELSAQS